ncbi:hypothetical protein [Hymenobacter sp. IS2118]|uniref:hypothetical protein n=1 Tax=Hymenobacter sp. IS2118 TaxID=1505605 RepID=UPI001268BDE3|nr:hypothetical protein [Hymenobacter sp. IS2118]
MKSALFLLVTLLPLLVACAASVPAYVRNSPPDTEVTRSRESEKIFRVAGYVLDAISRKPVPQVAVVCSGSQTTTDSAGYFIFNLTTRRFFNGILEVHTTCFDGKLVIGSHHDNLRLLLYRNRYQFSHTDACLPADSLEMNPYASPRLF